MALIPNNACMEGRRRSSKDDMVEILKNRFEATLQKKLGEGMPHTVINGQLRFPVEVIAGQYPLPAEIIASVEKKVLLKNLPSMVAGVWTEDDNRQLEATTKFRNLLLQLRNPPIQEVIQAGVVPRFVYFLAREDSPQLQFEAGWALSCITSGTSDHIKVVVDSGVVPLFVKLLRSPSDEFMKQAACTLGNVAGDSPEFRDLVLGYGALGPLLAWFKNGVKLSVVRSATWMLSKLFTGKPQPSFEKIRAALPVLRQLIRFTDEEVLTEACSALAYLTNGTGDEIQAVIGSGVCPHLVKLLLNPSPSVLIPALRTVGNIAGGYDLQTQCIINCGALPSLLKLLRGGYEKKIKELACFAIANITAGNSEQIQYVIDAGIFTALVNLVENAELEVKKEAAWAIANATCGGTHEQIKYLVSLQCIKPLCDLLVCPDVRMVETCLKGLEKILKVGEAEKKSWGVNVFAQMVDLAEGVTKMKNLQNDGNKEKAAKILMMYWADGGAQVSIHSGGVPVAAW